MISHAIPQVFNKMPTSLSEEIRAEMQRRYASGVSQSRMASESGTTQRAVSAFLAGGPVKSENLDRWAEWLGATLRIPKAKKTHRHT